MADTNEQRGPDDTSRTETTSEGPEGGEGPSAGGGRAGDGSGPEEQAGGEGGGAPPQRAGGGRGGLVLALLALLLVLGLGGGGAYFYLGLDQRLQGLETTVANREQQQEDLRQELSQEMDQATQELQSTVEQHGQQQGSIAERQEDLRNRVEQLGQEVETLRQANQELQARLEGGPTYWRLERVETLLVSADRIARLEGDLDAAHAALESADRTLRDMNAPEWMEARRAIQSAMTRLEELPEPDLPGTAFKLASLAESALELPVKGVEPPAMEPGEGDGEAEEEDPRDWWGRFRAGLEDFWEDVKGLVRLRRSGEEMEPLLPPDDATFLRHNLVLNLQSARLAALRGEDELYRRTLEESREWVRRFFDPDSDGVQAMLDSLESLGDRRITREAPSLEEPLTTFRGIRSEREE
ncbi:MAG: uroporphyrinogen-III C-methyltransferase [Thiohalorhabdus sp.]